MTTLSTIKRTSIRIAAVIVVATSVASMAPAEAQTKTATACPANFFSLDTIWYNNANKAIVSTLSGASNASARATSVPHE